MDADFNSKEYNPIIITFDGTSASGKGTLTKGLLAKLNDSRYRILDAGLMYRAITHFYQIQKDTSAQKLSNTIDLMSKLREEVQIEFNSLGLRINGNGIDEKSLRGPTIDPYVGKFAKLDDVKLYAVDLQKNIVTTNPSENGWILDGRCMGSAVAPEAQAKFFVDAPSLVRATRRHIDYVKQGKTGFSTEAIYIDLEERDRDDYNTKIAPLLKPDDAIEINTFQLGPEEGIEHAFKYVQRKIEEEGKL